MGDYAMDGVAKKNALNFVCNVCGKLEKNCDYDRIGRETPSCSNCHSTVRMRSIVHLLSEGLFGRSRSLTDFPVSRNIKGVGLSDWDGYAKPLEVKFDYKNTFYHTEPFLDITAPADRELGAYDFVISTEVFEHVVTPVSRAFQGAFDILKPGGVFVFTVPFTNNAETTEHFPNLNEYRIVDFDGEYVLVNKRKDGNYEVHENLVFHGGPGTTLEMRVFCRNHIEAELMSAGFDRVKVMEFDIPSYGIIHHKPWSLPIVAFKPKG